MSVGRRQQKEEEVRALREKFRRARVAVLAGFSGMTVDEMRGLKSQFRRARGEFTVVKNTLARRAAEGTDAAPLADLFSGPTAVALGYDDPLLPVRILKDFSEKQEKLKIRRGVIERQVVDLSALKALARLPGREALRAQVLGVIVGPLYGFVGILSGVLSEFSRVLHARAEVQNNSNAQEGKEEAMEKLSQEELISELEGLTVLQLARLNKTLQEKWGVTAAPPVTAAAPAGTAVPGAPAAEEKTTFDAVLTGAGDKKIQVIKVVRELTNLGLKEAKDLVEGAPKPIKGGVSKEEAESIKKRIEEVGGKVEVK